MMKNQKLKLGDLVLVNIPLSPNHISDDPLFCGVGVIVDKGDNDDFEDRTLWRKEAWVIYSEGDFVHAREEHIAILCTK